jgi:hypothetical protein
MKISKTKGPVDKIKMKTKSTSDTTMELQEWWPDALSDAERAAALCSTAAYLKTNQTYRTRQLAVDIRMYCGLSVYSYAGSNVSKMDQTKTLPDDRPTFNLISACTDTLVSRISQARPTPVFLTDNSDYKERHLAQSLNQFILGEFYQVKAYEKGAQVLRDTCVMGTGALKVYEDCETGKVAVDRVMTTDLYVDNNDAVNGEPTQLYQLKLMDRGKLMARYPKEHKIIENCDNALPDNVPDTARTVADQIMVVEGWKLPSSPDAGDGRHTIACVNGLILDEPWEKDSFPFVFMNYSDPFLGFFGQGVATRLFGTQMTLNRILYTIARAITLVGVPRVFQEQNSKVVSAHNNNEIGVIVKYSGVKPSYEVAPCNAPELYQERDRLIQYGFQQEGISPMQASSMKPAGLDSGEAQRVYDDISTDRMFTVSKRYSNLYIQLAYKITDVAMDIAKRDGKYQTIYPNKDGTKEIDLPAMTLLQDPFVIQCFDESSLPRDPAGRTATVIEWVQSGMITLKEGRRLMRAPMDLEQNEKLSNASEERIFKYLDEIVEDGKYTPPDPFMDLATAEQLVVQYYNLYVAAKLEDKKEQMLRDFFTQIQTLKQAAMPAPMPQAPTAPANPMPTPTSNLLPNTNAPVAA